MKSISSIVESIIKSKPFISEAMEDGIINYSGLARHIKDDVEDILMKPVNESTIITALKRFSPDLNIKLRKTVDKLMNNFGEIVVRSHIEIFTYANSDTIINSVKKISDNFALGRNYFYNVSSGVFETTLIVSDNLSEHIIKYFSDEKIIIHAKGLASITIKLPELTFSQPGLYYTILKRVAWQGVSLHEVVSTTNELSLVMNEKDVSKVIDIL